MQNDSDKKPGYRLVNIHAFPGFYESALDAMIDDEIESVFNTDDSGCNSNIPSAIYGGSGVEYHVDYSEAHIALAKEYLSAWMEQFKGETGIALDYEYESYSSPRYYNFETDRLFCWISDASIAALFEASAADNHKQLAEHIAARFTSRSGFISSYPNDLESWLEKPVAEWDHNELATLLDAVLSIHCDESQQEQLFNTWELMESFRCNGGLSNAVWEGIPEKIRRFADMQREYGKPVDFDLWIETGKAYPEGTAREDLEKEGEVLPLPCPNTLDLFNTK